MNTVVVGYTPKPPGEAALRLGVEESRLRRARLLVVRSHQTELSPHQGRPHDDGQLHRLLSELIPYEDVSYEVREERGIDPAEDVLGLATHHEATLIVIGLRRRSAVGKFLLGSTAQRILLEAPCPVLAVKP
ncbi:universal stress protein [Nocardioides sp. NPDC127503]|uniref:universal stress protein n=1 Tax=Nocardioides sp. NPDC127503 TaxID=3154516 RepID=UPI00331F5FCB